MTNIEKLLIPASEYLVFLALMVPTFVVIAGAALAIRIV